MLVLSTLSIYSFFFNLDQIKSIVDLRKVNIFTFLKLSMLFCILTLAGTPPFMSFTGKWLLIVAFFNSEYHVQLFFFLGLNMFGVYFYGSIVRSLINQPLEDGSLNRPLQFKTNFITVYYMLILMSIITLNLFLYSELLSFFISIFT